jgi:hypothetical protein
VVLLSFTAKRDELRRVLATGSLVLTRGNNKTLAGITSPVTMSTAARHCGDTIQIAAQMLVAACVGAVQQEIHWRPATCW